MDDVRASVGGKWMKKYNIFTSTILVAVLIILSILGSVGVVMAEETDSSTTVVNAAFYVVKEGGSRTNYSSTNYISLGKGQVSNPETIKDDEESIKSHFVTVPDLSSLGLTENQTIQWYSLKKEADGWHVDGEIISIQTESSEVVESSSVMESSEVVEGSSVVESSEVVESSSVVESDATAQETVIVNAAFYVIKEGGSKTNYSSTNYKSLGKGQVVNPETIKDDNAAIVAHVVLVPDLSSLGLAENQTIQWYSLKKEVDGWHVDGEIVTLQTESSEVVESSSIIESSSVIESSEIVESSSVIESSEIVESSSVIESNGVAESSSVIESTEVEEDSAGEMEEVEVVTAKFYLVKEGGSRTNYSSTNYISLGKGEVSDPETIKNDDTAIRARFVTVPDMSSLGLTEDKTIEWYSLKKENDGWHVDGEIIASETEESIEIQESETVEIDENTESNSDKVYKILESALLTVDGSSKDVSSYKITADEIENVIWPKVVENNYIEYITYNALSVYVAEKKGYATKVMIRNLESEYTDKIPEVRAEVENVLSQISDEMTDVEKVLFIHEYLVDNVYYKAETDICYWALGPLTERYAVCSGYSAAMKALLHMVGIDAYNIVSGSMNHGWTMVELDGELYHIDVTWDDTQKGTNNSYQHRFLLRNDKEFSTIAAARVHSDWMSYEKDNIESDSIKYTEWFVHDVAGTMYYCKGLWYYYDVDSNSIMRSDIEGKMKTTVVDGSKLTQTVKLIGISDNKLNYSIGNTNMTKSL